MGHTFDYILVDGKNLLFRTAWANQALQHNGRLTGGIYGFLRTLLSVRDAFSAPWSSPIIEVCWEGKRNWRFTRYPAYKGNRSRRERAEGDFDTAAAVHAQLPVLQEMLTLAGIAQRSTYDGECDDVLYTLAQEYARDGGYKVGVLTQDRDLYQVTSAPFCSVVRVDRDSNWEVIDTDAAVAELGVPPDKFVALKALAGDSSDNIPGARGIGPKTAAKLLQDHDLEALLDAALTGYNWPGSDKQREAVIAASTDVRVYADIIALQKVEVSSVSPDAPDLPFLQDALERLGILSLANEPEISNICNLREMEPHREEDELAW